jgi:glycerol-3-phosphate dehydrogenase
MLAGLKPRRQVIDADRSVDLLVIGAGATGTSVARAAARSGLRVALLEAHDHGSGTSSRSSKLLHGGVRYLAQGRLGLVRQALQERSHFLSFAPHLAQALPFVVPSSSWAEHALHRLGLGFYQHLAGTHSLGATQRMAAADLRQTWPELKHQDWVGGVAYWDALFEDARMALWLAMQAQDAGAHVLNHAEVVHLQALGQAAFEVTWRDRLGGSEHVLRAGCVINAAGVWVDRVRGLQGQARNDSRGSMKTISPSQGIHLVLRWPHGAHDHRHALLSPRTEDGRVLFFIPWLGHCLIGTTDTMVSEISHEPRPLEEDIDFLCREASRVLQTPVDPAQVQSVWAGLRPLAVGPDSARSGSGGRVSREHAIHVDEDGLISVLGGNGPLVESWPKTRWQLLAESPACLGDPGPRTVLK